MNIDNTAIQQVIFF